jgi:BatD DUF11 like domain
MQEDGNSLILQSMIFGKVHSGFLIFLLLSQTLGFGKSGDVSIKYGRNKIGLNQAFSITISIENEYLKSYSDFPVIKGFRKMGTSSSTNTTIVNGKMTVISSITQNYFPSSQGTFKLKDFSMEVNGKPFKAKGINIEVGAPIRQQRRQDPFAWDPFEDYQDPQELEYVDVEADAFLSVTTDKREVFKGEGFNMAISFFVAQSNQAQMRWPGDLSDQLTEAIKKIKPGTVWEENFNIHEIHKKKVKLRGKIYDQYVLYQATFFPLTEEDIFIPSISLTLVKYKEATTRSFFGRPKIEDRQKFKSTPKKIKVKPLPFHPLSEMVSVGIFKLKESMDSGPYKTGESFIYNFSVKGIGNISGIRPPETPQDENFDFFTPEVIQNIKRENNRITGSKKFQYYAVPKEPGKFSLDQYFNWVYFDPKREVYDTLVSKIKFTVEGKSKKNSIIKSSDLGDFYDRIEISDNTLANINEESFPFTLLQILTILLMLASTFFFFKR